MYYYKHALLCRVSLCLWLSLVLTTFYEIHHVHHIIDFLSYQLKKLSLVFTFLF